MTGMKKYKAEAWEVLDEVRTDRIGGSRQERIIIGERDEYIEFSELYSVKSFFEIWSSNDLFAGWKRIFEDWAAQEVEGQLTCGQTQMAKLANKICSGFVKRNSEDKPFKVKGYTESGGATSQFVSGSRASNKSRDAYINYLLKEGSPDRKDRMNQEVERQKRLLQPLVEKTAGDDLKQEIGKFLGTGRKVCNGQVFQCEGFFQVIEKVYKEKNVSQSQYYTDTFLQRFQTRYQKDPIDAVARLLILVMAGGYAFHLAGELFSFMGERSEAEVKSGYLYHRFLVWNRSRSMILSQSEKQEVLEIYQEAEACVRSGNKTARISYILAKTAEIGEGSMVSPKDFKYRENLYEECIRLGEDEGEGMDDLAEILADAAYQLFHIYHRNRRSLSAVHSLIKAAEYGHPDACNLLAEFWLDQMDIPIENDGFINKYEEMLQGLRSLEEIMKDKLSEIPGFVLTEERGLDRLISWYQKAGDGHAYVRIAQCLKVQGADEEDIISAWYEAYHRGEDWIREKIQKLDRQDEKVSDQAQEQWEREQEKYVCILCSESPENLIFYNTLPYRYKVILVHNGKETEETKGKWKEVLAKREAVAGKKDIIVGDLSAAFGELRLLQEDRCQGQPEDEILVVDYGSDLQEKYQRLTEIFSRFGDCARDHEPGFVSDRVKLCTDLNQWMTELHMDRLQRELGDRYLPVYDNMYEKNASLELLTRRPLFAMDMGKEVLAKERHIVLAGISETSLQLIKDMVSVCCVTRDAVKYYIHLVDRGAGQIRKKLFGECSGIIEPAEETNYQIEFHETEALEYLDLQNQELVYHRMESGEKEVQREAKGQTIPLLRCDYFVCATDDDLFNIYLARQIRIGSMRETEHYDVFPVIAVLCKEKELVHALENLTSTGKYKLEYPWYEGFNLTGFGARQDYYSYQFITENWVRKWGMSVNLAYCNLEDKQQTEDACNDFYSRWYNRDSSCMSAVFFIYRFYLAGLYRKWVRWDFRFFVDKVSRENSRLLKDYRSYIENPDNRDRQAELEHVRWCEWMKSRGWMKPGNDSQVENYMKAGHGKVLHQLHTARIHPYMVSWEELGESVTDRVIAELEKIRYKYYHWDQKWDGAIRYLEQVAKRGRTSEQTTEGCLKDIIEELEQIREDLQSGFSEQDTEMMKSMIGCINGCINVMSDILYSGKMESSGLQLKMEIWYQKIGKTFRHSTKAHDRMIVSRTVEFLTDRQKQESRSF